MKAREIAIRLRRFELNEKRQKVTDLECMIADFQRMSDDLKRQIEIEEQRAGVRDVNHFAYPTFAKAAVQRRENLMSSIAELTQKLEEARAQLADAIIEMNKAELAGDVAAERTEKGDRAAPGGFASASGRQPAAAMLQNNISGG
jgi:flagellar export protein FliJ